jgi:hypothetical protein
LPIRSFGVLFVIALFFSTTGALGQTWQLGIKGGLSLPNLFSPGGSTVSSGYTSISGPDFEVFGDYKFSEGFSIESGLEWSTQGGQKSGVQTIPAIPGLAQYFPPGTQFLYASFSSTVRLQYLMLPVLLKYTVNLGNTGRWKLYVDGGFFGAYLVTATGSAQGLSKVYFDKEETRQVGSEIINFDSTGNIKSHLRTGNFGVEGNLGLIYQMKSTGLFVEGGGNYGFVNLQKTNSNGINHTGALVFRIGIFFDLKQGEN